jgi:hypothetical protein
VSRVPEGYQYSCIERPSPLYLILLASPLYGSLVGYLLYQDLTVLASLRFVALVTWILLATLYYLNLFSHPVIPGSCWPARSTWILLANPHYLDLVSQSSLPRSC